MTATIAALFATRTGAVLDPSAAPTFDPFRFKPWSKTPPRFALRVAFERPTAVPCDPTTPAPRTSRPARIPRRRHSPSGLRPPLLL